MSIVKLKKVRPDHKISYLCRRGAHEGNDQTVVCKGRSCTCNCHPINLKTPFCIVCDKRRTDKPDQVCRICSGEKFEFP